MLPVEVPSVDVYAGDTCVFPTYTFKEAGVATDLVDAGWGNWTATWRRKISADEAISLRVDVSQASVGLIAITASSEMTRQMDGAGVWDLQAERTDEIRTFLRGVTTYTKDVTRG